MLPADEVTLRVDKVCRQMTELSLDAVLVGDNANVYYLTGRVFCGYVYITARGEVQYFLRRPSELHGDDVIRYRKVEEMTGAIAAELRDKTLGLTLDDVSYSLIQRLEAGLGPDVKIGNASTVLRRARAAKTPLEIKMLETSGIKQAEVYSRIPHLYKEGMTDVELQIEIERSLRLHGCLGEFRCSGTEMEIFMGNVLTGDNADTPSPYDFAMGGAGLDPSIPVGANGTIIRPGKPVMVDMNGNITGYMTDMTRCYIAGSCPELATNANELSANICRAVSGAARPGVAAKDLYKIAEEMVAEAKMEDYFMGHRYHAGFVGHGIGITVNELPVLAPRSRDILEVGNVIALEPKFVIPGLGAVGVENTYVVQHEGPAKQITNAPEQIMSLT